MEIEAKKNLKEILIEEFEKSENKVNGNEPFKIHQVRRDAINNFQALGFPNRKHEEWRFTNVDFINRHNFQLQTGGNDSDIEPADIEQFLFKEMNENLLVFINGFFSKKLSRISLNGNGFRIGSLVEAFKNDSELLRQHFGKYANSEKDAFTAINTAFAHDGAFILVPDGAVIEKPVHFLYITDTRKSEVLTHPRNLIIAGECSTIKIIETRHTFGANPGFTNMVSEFVLNFASNVEFYKIQNDSKSSYYIGTTQVIQERGSVFNGVTISLLGNFIRNNLNTVFNDEGCEANFNGFYYIDGNSFVDNHTLIDHAVPNCNSNEIYKGILDDNAAAVFNGKVMVRPNAQKTNAYQTNRNIMLTDTAKINTKPQLEIFADDVKCSHGATSGYLDKDSLFYLKSRGIGEKMAKSLLLSAFAGEVIEKINISELRDDIKRQVAERLSVEDVYFCDVIDKVKS